MMNGETLLAAWEQYLRDNPLRFNHEDEGDGIKKHIRFFRVFEALFHSLVEALQYIKSADSLHPGEETLLKALDESGLYMVKHPVVLFLIQNTMAILQKEESDDVDFL